ncbi:hypothetical protein BDE02_10G089400 [Populus trichocarpa]|nr:hypothetical protein BDE02_10G089400 [Populus trichocarpa]
MDCVIIEIFDVYSRICKGIARPVLMGIYSTGDFGVCNASRAHNQCSSCSESYKNVASHEDANKALVVREDVVIVREKEVVNSRLKTLIISHFRASNTSSAENRPNDLPLYQKQDIPDFISFY